MNYFEWLEKKFSKDPDLIVRDDYLEWEELDPLEQTIDIHNSDQVKYEHRK